jgi:hypothetical protein
MVFEKVAKTNRRPSLLGTLARVVVVLFGLICALAGTELAMVRNRGEACQVDAENGRRHQNGAEIVVHSVGLSTVSILSSKSEGSLRRRGEVRLGDRARPLSSPDISR